MVYNQERMIDKLVPGDLDARRKEYLKGLYIMAVKGNTEAGGELSVIALGGNQLARDLVRKMDKLLLVPISKKPV